MGYDIRRAFEQSIRIVKAHDDVPAGIGVLLAEQRTLYPSYDWSRIERLPFGSDAEALADWLARLLRTEPPGPDVSAFWFGLFDPVRFLLGATRGLYVAGSRRFIPPDPHNEWQVGPEYWPKGRYARTKVLEALYRASASARKRGQRDVGDELDFTWCLTYVGLTVRHVARVLGHGLLLDGREYRGFGFGFDSGDLITLGILRRDGFELLDEVTRRYDETTLDDLRRELLGDGMAGGDRQPPDIQP